MPIEVARTNTAVAVPVDESAEVLKAMEGMLQAFKNGRRGEILEVMPPQMLRASGISKERLSIEVEKLSRQMSEQIKLVSYDTVPPFTFASGASNRFVIVPTLMKATYQGRLGTAKSCLVGVKPDCERRWYFWDAGTMHKAIIQIHFPDFPTNLVMPKFELTKEE